MARQVPNPLLYLQAIFRPKSLRPDIRVPSISSVDFQALRRRGFNAVIIDKDNCLTIPHRDELYPPLQESWTNLLAAFPKGRVLIVSNSAGTNKDPGGIGAESLSLSLCTPTLLHPHPKPSCTPLILSYLLNPLLTTNKPHTLRNTIHHTAHAIRKVEKGDEEEIVGRWLKDVERGRLLDEGLGRGFGGGGGGKGGKGGDPFAEHEGGRERREEKVGEVEDVGRAEKRAEEIVRDEEVRVIVIGDRQFTDVLLAHRLRSALPPTIPPPPKLTSTTPPKNAMKQDRVISILTTHLPQPNDLLPIRWLEKALSRNKIRKGTEDWGRFVYTPNEAKVVEPKRIVRLGWNPKKWTLTGLIYTLGRGLRGIYRLSKKGVSWGLWKWRSRGLGKGENVSLATTEEYTRGAIETASPSGRGRISSVFAWIVSLFRQRKSSGETLSVKTAERLTTGAS